MLIGIFITLVIFVFIIAVYDVLKECIVLYYSRKLSHNEDVATSKAEARKIVATAEASFNVTVVFALFAMGVALITLPILFTIFLRQ